MLETWEAESSPSQRFRVGGREDRRGLATPSLFPTPGSANRSAPLGTSAFSLSGRRAQPTAARRGPRAPPPFSRFPLPFFPSRYNDWAGTAPQPCLIGSSRPSPRRGGGRGQLGREEPRAGADSEEEAGRTEGLQDARKAARSAALSVDQSEDARRAAAGATNCPGSGDAAGAGCPASPGVWLRG